MLVYPLALCLCLTIVVYSSIVSNGLIWPYNPLVLYGLIALSLTFVDSNNIRVPLKCDHSNIIVSLYSYPLSIVKGDD